MTTREIGQNQGQCFNCHRKGHFARDCPYKQDNNSSTRDKQWCSYHKSTTHSDENCWANKSKCRQVNDAKQIKGPDIKQAEEDIHSFAFKVCETVSGLRKQGLMVDTGATSHIITRDIFKTHDGTFDPSQHFIELADGSRKNNIVKKVGDVEIFFKQLPWPRLGYVMRKSSCANEMTLLGNI